MRYELKMEFQDEEEKRLERLNQILGALPIVSCKVEDLSFCGIRKMVFSEEGEETTSYEMRLEAARLICEDASEEGELKRVYQLETMAFPLEKGIHTEAFVQEWREKHPDRIIRQVREIEYDFMIGFSVLYMKK